MNQILLLRISRMFCVPIIMLLAYFNLAQGSEPNSFLLEKSNLLRENKCVPPYSGRCRTIYSSQNMAEMQAQLAMFGVGKEEFANAIAILNRRVSVSECCLGLVSDNPCSELPETDKKKICDCIKDNQLSRKYEFCPGK